MARFSQALSEGDGISLIPALTGDVEELARAAEDGGAEAVAVDSPGDVERVRTAAGLPVLLRRRVQTVDELGQADVAGADAVLLGVGGLAADDGSLEELHAAAIELGFDVAIEVADEEDLLRALDLVDPDIVWISDRRGDDEEAFERTLDLLPDVPAGKLVISESRAVVREQVLALERAGVDGLLVGEVGRLDDVAGTLSRLAGSGE